MEAFADVAPAHNPPYIKAMRMLARAVPRAPAGRRLRDRLPPDDPRGQPALRRPRGVGDQVRHPPLGLPRRQPPLHRRPDGRAARPRRPEADLLPPRRQLLALRDPRRQVGRVQPGDEPADRACRTTTASATSTSSPCRSSSARPARRSTQVLDILANRSGLEGLSGAGRDLRDIEAAAERGRTPRRRWRSTSSSPRSATTSGPTSSSWAGPTRSSSPAASARTRSRIRVGRLPRPGLVRHRARPGRERRRRRPSAIVSAAGSRVAGLDRADQRGDRRRPPGARPARVGRSPVDLTCNRRSGSPTDVRRPSDRQRGGHPEGGVDDRAQAADRRALPGRREGARPPGADRPDVRRGRHAGRRARTRWS